MLNRHLFRGKRGDNGKWIFGCLLRLTETRYAATDEYPMHLYDVSFADKSFHSGKMSIQIYEVDPATVGQCTGMRDKNGTLIFEGDFIYNPDEGGMYTVEWWRHGWYLNMIDNWEDLEDYHAFNKGELEIIGNIHDNPELLE